MGKILHCGRSGIGAVVACAAFAVAAVVSSCVRKELYVKPDEGRVLLDIDWRELAPGEAEPDRMSVYFYGADGSWVRGTAENGRFDGMLPSGNYKVLVVNETVEGVGYAGMEDFDRAYVYALPSEGKVAGGDQWIRQPGWVYSAHVSDLSVAKEDTVRRVLMPEPLVKRVVLNIRLTGDYDAVTDLSAVLTGVAPSVRLVTGECADGYASMTEFDPRPAAAGIYTASVLVFGVSAVNPDGSPADNLVRLGLDFNNGGSQVIEENITGEGIEDPTEIEIDVNIDIEVSATSEAGFSAVVTRWEVTDGDEMEVDNRPGGTGFGNVG